MAKRNVFYSFHYKPDSHRAARIRSIGAIDGNAPTSDNDWEKIKQGGDQAIKKWIDGQMYGKSCAVILVGAQTASRPWVIYEIKKAWNDGKGVLAIKVHKMVDLNDNIVTEGVNPLTKLSVGATSMSSIACCYNPPRSTSQGVRNYIADNIADWVEDAIKIRKDH